MGIIIKHYKIKTLKMRTKQSIGGKFGKSHVEARLANKRRNEKELRELQRHEEEMAAQQAYEDDLFWQPVDKKDRRHKMKIQTMQVKALEAQEKKAAKWAAYAEEEDF